MELEREARDEIVTATLGAAGRGAESEASTMMLRRCTALAARARVDLLSPHRCDAADELVDLLAQMKSWDPMTIGTPDPTMTVLAAAALQDLAERLQLAELRKESSPTALLSGIDAVLTMLRGLMAEARVEVPA